MKKSKKNYVAIVLVVLLLALAVGYAAFSQTLTISGTAGATGKWDVKFTNATASASIVKGTQANTATLSEDGKSITVKVNLATQGDGSNITATITNGGTVDAKLKEFLVSGDLTQDGTNTNVYQNGAIKLTVPTLSEEDVVIKAGESKTFTFSVEWDDTKTLSADTETATFDITFDYVQDGITGTFTGTQGWN